MVGKLLELNTDTGRREAAESKLSTDGASDCETCAQATALELNVELCRGGYTMVRTKLLELHFISRKIRTQVLRLLDNLTEPRGPAGLYVCLEPIRGNASNEILFALHFPLPVEQPQMLSFSLKIHDSISSQGNDLPLEPPRA